MQGRRTITLAVTGAIDGDKMSGTPSAPGRWTGKSFLERRSPTGQVWPE
jgi:hypothetical protein